MLFISIKSHFPLGQIIITKNAFERLPQGSLDAGIKRHGNRDWGNVRADMNDFALCHGGRLVSAYGAGASEFWVITESDRSLTTVMLPEDY